MAVSEESRPQRTKSPARTRLMFLRGLRQFSYDDFFEASSTIFATIIIVIITVASIILVRGSVPVLQSFGTGFFTGTSWISVAGSEAYGVLPYVLGTLVTSAIAVAVGVPLSLGIAIFLAEMAPWSVRAPLSRVIELLAAVPSFIYGFWGLFVFRLWIRDYIERPISSYVGSFPVFQGTPFGLDILTAGLILAIMIIPTVSSISKDVMMAVPSSQREAAYSIGATRWEVVRTGVLGYARSGIFGATILGLGRAVGETMAVTMVIGNASGPAALPTSLFRQGATMASVIANEFSEAEAGSLHLSALIGIGLTLFLFALVINVFAQLMVWRVLKVRGGSVE
jgi:phosphate transport system permease protein